MSCYASILAPARGSGLALRPAHRGSGSILPVVPARTHLPRWTGGAPSPKLQASAGKKAWCTKPGGSFFPDPEWFDFNKPAPSSEPSGWMEPWDHTQVNVNLSPHLRTSPCIACIFSVDLAMSCTCFMLASCSVSSLCGLWAVAAMRLNSFLV